MSISDKKNTDTFLSFVHWYRVKRYDSSEKMKPESCEPVEVVALYQNRPDIHLAQNNWSSTNYLKNAWLRRSCQCKRRDTV